MSKKSKDTVKLGKEFVEQVIREEAKTRAQKMQTESPDTSSFSISLQYYKPKKLESFSQESPRSDPGAIFAIKINRCGCRCG